jgi:hypothetical protein
MKKLLLITLLALSAYADIKVDLLEEKQVNYPNGMMGPTQFRILCINGYKWLQFGNSNGSMAQMFEWEFLLKTTPIKCENKK